jgi:hypothetical protein
VRIHILALVCAAPACGSSTVGTNDAGVDMAAAILDQGSTPDAAGPLMLKKVGIVNATSPGGATDAGNAIHTALSASFTDYSGGGSRWQRSTIGPCELNVSGTGGVEADAGKLTFSGGAMPETLDHSPGGYNTLNLNQTLWPAGSTVSVAAAGATVPAWSAVVTMPEAALPTGPDLAGTPSWPRTSDFTVTWQGGTKLVTISLSNSGGSLRCDFPATAKSGTVPAEALGRLAAGRTTVIALSTDRQVVSAGEWVISMVAFTTSDPIYGGAIMLQ